jgi:hypothetical protein
MPEKDPSTYSLITYGWVLALSALGGAVNFVRKVKEGAARAFNITELFGELITSGFAGLLTFWLCEWSSVSPLLSAVLIGISGHMGSRAIFRMEKWAEDKFGSVK